MTMQKAALDCFLNPPTDLDYQGRAYLCLAFVRSIVMRAYGISWLEFYDKVVTEKVERPKGLPKNEWIARDFERGARNKGWAIKPGEERPGDIVFKYDTAYYNPGELYLGHVAVYVGAQLFYSGGKWIMKEVVIENARPEWRKGLLANKGCIVLSDYATFPAVTTRIRLPDTREGLLGL